jgi:hypothetical protein
LPDSRSDLELAAASQSHQTQPHDSSSRALNVDSVDLSSDDDEVENLLEQALEDVQEDTRDMSSADDFIDNHPRRSLHKAKIIASQREKSTSTMVKDKKTKT